MDETEKVGTDSDGENEESAPDGVKKEIKKLINRFKHFTSKDRGMLDSDVTQDSDVKEMTVSSTDDDVYGFCPLKRGYAVFIINKFENQKGMRPYADQDYEHMLELFKMLHFEVKILKDRTRNDLKAELIAIKSQIGQDCDCFACVISSHGEETTVASKSDRRRQHFISTVGGRIPTSEIMDVFNSDQCPNLDGKPRLFFIQACRSICVAKTNDLSSIDQGFEFGREYEYTPKTQNNTTDVVETCEIPCYEDCLVMFSSSSRKIAWADSKKGGWLIYCLYEVFKHLLDSDEYINLLHVLINVCRKMASELQTHTPSSPAYHKSKSAATIYHMLTKDIILKPKSVGSFPISYW